jgi:hypothetical protein
MIIDQMLNCNCNVQIDIENLETKKVDTIHKHNLVVTSGKNLIRDLLGIVAGVTGLNYFAIGTDNTAVVVGDTTLGTEVFRDVFTSKTYAAGQIIIKYFLASGSANGNTLTEAGLFGDDATGAADSGTLFARVVHSGVAKTSSIAITYTWTITIS